MAATSVNSLRYVAVCPALPGRPRDLHGPRGFGETGPRREAQSFGTPVSQEEPREAKEPRWEAKPQPHRRRRICRRKRSRFPRLENEDNCFNEEIPKAQVKTENADLIISNLALCSLQDKVTVESLP